MDNFNFFANDNNIFEEEVKCKMEKVIEINNLVKKYREIQAINNLSFAVNKGEILGLLGPNGSGKSTTINCILSLLKYDSGSIEIFGEKMNIKSYDIKSKIGVVFQDVAVFNELTVYENIDYFCGLYIKDKNTRKKCVNDAINLVKLDDFKKFYPNKLSGGLLRRLNIACGIAHNPKLIFFDEPTVAVDPQSRNNILQGIKKLSDNGATIVYTTHYMEEVEILCDRVIILDKGKIIAEGSPKDLKKMSKIKEIISVDITNLEDKDIKYLNSLDDVDSVKYNEATLNIKFKRDNNLISVIKYFEKNNLQYDKIDVKKPTLNDVFLELTGKELRD